MSSPRAATSVATTSSSVPARSFFITRSRSACEIPPCSASTRSPRPFRLPSDRPPRAASGRTPAPPSATPCPAPARGPPACARAPRRRPSAAPSASSPPPSSPARSRCAPGSSGASPRSSRSAAAASPRREPSAAPDGVTARIASRSSANPMSSISSASSRTSVRNASSFSDLAVHVIERPPGRRDHHVHPALQRPELRVHRGARRTPAAPAPRSSSRTDAPPPQAASRARASEPGSARPDPPPFRCSAAIACRIGSANAAVFPVPVAACASTSRPSRSGGIDCCWMGVGSS